jgi:hypothetical protein
MVASVLGPSCLALADIWVGRLRTVYKQQRDCAKSRAGEDGAWQGDPHEPGAAVTVCAAARAASSAVTDVMVRKDPVVVFEIISPSTSGVDRIVKLREYGNTASIQRFVILERSQKAAAVFTRETGRWAAVVTLDVPFPPPPSRDDEPPRM